MTPSMCSINNDTRRRILCLLPSFHPPDVVSLTHRVRPWFARAVAIRQSKRGPSPIPRAERQISQTIWPQQLSHGSCGGRELLVDRSIRHCHLSGSDHYAPAITEEHGCRHRAATDQQHHHTDCFPELEVPPPVDNDDIPSADAQVVSTETTIAGMPSAHRGLEHKPQAGGWRTEQRVQCKGAECGEDVHPGLDGRVAVCRRASP
mmetsp:Transcript_19981/g.48496  ORF Transcript_19981/g.48496 Transcript_19981/m.48496 type:complete len:205 (-) Transcript_19981:566-1180(-)